MVKINFETEIEFELGAIQSNHGSEIQSGFPISVALRQFIIFNHKRLQF